MRTAAFAIGLCLSARLGAAQWTPPIGVPAPGFGISESAPATPAAWKAPVAGFYYIEEARGTDDNNPLGTPDRPRRTIPRSLPAGAVVTVRGRYTQPHASPNTIEAHGTVDAPVFIEGGAFTGGGNELTGTYAIVERGTSVGWVIRDTPSAGPTHHIVVRDTEITGGGIGIGAYLGGAIHDIVVLRTSIHDVGDMKVKTDVDAHCVSIGVSDHVWVLDSLFTRCSGDGVQINGGRNGSKLHHVYIGRNGATENRQSGFWAKQSADVVISSNVVSNMRPGTGGPGNCVGAQYGAARIVFLNNRLSDCEYGIGVWSYDDGAPGGVLIAGNVITNIHRTTTDGSIGNPWAGGAAIFLAGGGERVVVHNTIVDVDGGIQAPRSPGVLNIGNNIIARVARAAMSFEGDGTTPRVNVAYMLYDALPTMVSSGVPATAGRAELVAAHNVIASPRFVDAAAGDFRLQPGSPGTQASAPIAALSDAFRSVHGVPLGLDLSGTPDVGALGSARLPKQQAPAAPGYRPRERR